ncbi:RICIN domain-containing protein [Actinokineospora fastidiosa]|nr:RICIN domain-containing protein [Actinokineospora fastidiosa]
MSDPKVNDEESEKWMKMRLGGLVAAAATAVLMTLSLATPVLASATVPAEAAVNRAGTASKDVGAQEVYYTWRNWLTNKCLDQNWSGGVNRHTAIAYNCHGGDNQYWQLEWLGTNIYRVRNFGSGECLHQKYDGSTPTTTVQVLACTDANWINQRWRVTEWNDGSYTFKNVRSEWFLDQSFSGGVERQEVVAYPFNGGANQYWY